MKLTQKKLRQIIKEEMTRLVEAPSFGIDRRPLRGYHDSSSRPSRAELDLPEIEYLGDEGGIEIYYDPASEAEGTLGELLALRKEMGLGDSSSPF